MKTHHKIILGDSRDMSYLSDESVHLIVTSPPYWQLKDYNVEGQIGFDDSYEEYINNLNLVWSESYRVLSPGCRMCINIGDQFARSVYYGRYKVIPIRTEIIKFCETIGFDYMGAVIWQKVTTTNTTGGATIMGSFPYPRNGILKIDYEFILLFKKPGKTPIVDRSIKEASRLTKDEWNEYFSGHWSFTGEKQAVHLAMFPEELPRRLIRMFSFVGDSVLDPFLGSGTTILAAKNLGRNSIGFEINRNFIEIIKNKLNSDQQDAMADYEYIKASEIERNFKDRLLKLPYVFKDPIKFDRKVDPRKFGFGSKINNSPVQTSERYFTIKQIVSPELLILNNDLQIRLIGVKVKSETASIALTYLKSMTKGHKVILKYDNEKFDKDNNLQCYVYLTNKTFINAHLIKSGLVDIDFENQYRLKSKFIDLKGSLNA